MESVEHHVRDTYNRIAETYYQKRNAGDFFLNEYVEMPATLSLLNNIKGQKVLDLGCGPGIYAKILNSRGAKVYGLDISKNMIKIAKSHAENANFVVGTAYKLPYDSNSFDLVLSTFVVGHLEKLDTAFKEINRVLKLGGTFIFSIYNPILDATHPVKGNRVQSFLSDRTRVFDDYYREGLHEQIWWKGTRDEIKIIHICRTYQTWIRALRNNGFELVDYIDAKPSKQARKIDLEEFRYTSRVPSVCIFKSTKV